MMRVEVAFATPERQEIVSLMVPDGTSMKEAVTRSGIQQLFPDHDLSAADMGVFGKVVKNPASHPLRDGDRVEIYRPLIIDPKQARLNRAKNKTA